MESLATPSLTGPAALMMKKKLPFKPTALRSPALLRSSPVHGSGRDSSQFEVVSSGREAEAVGEEDKGEQQQDSEEDTLALFRRAKEMAPIVEADRERRMRRQLQKQQEQQEQQELEAERARKASINDRLSTADEQGAADAQQTPEATPTAAQSSSSYDGAIKALQETYTRDIVTPPPSKRRRQDTSTSSKRHRDTEAHDAGDFSLDSPIKRTLRSYTPNRSVTPAVSSTLPHGTPTTSDRYMSTPTRNYGAPLSGIQAISIDSDSEMEELSAPSIRAPATEKPPVKVEIKDLDADADALEDDDEFAEYVVKAQEERDRLLAQQARPSPSPSPLSPSSSSSMATIDHLPTGTKTASAPLPMPPLPPPLQRLQKPVIEIFITSQVPGSRGCLVKYHFDRPLRVVRDSWVALQHRHKADFCGQLGPDDDVILTWRRKKVYMASTLQSLGIRPGVDGFGARAVDGNARQGFNESGSRVLMQAWTPALFALMERDEETRRRREAGELSDDDDEGGDDGGDGGVQQVVAAASGEAETGGGDQDDGEDEVKMRVILKPRAMEPVKLMVRPATTTETLTAAIRARHAIGESACVSLWFDGMRLAEGATMADADIDDMDTIDVHINMDGGEKD